MLILEAILYPSLSGFWFNSEEIVQIENNHKQYNYFHKFDFSSFTLKLLMWAQSLYKNIHLSWQNLE